MFFPLRPTVWLLSLPRELLTFVGRRLIMRKLVSLRYKFRPADIRFAILCVLSLTSTECLCCWQSFQEPEDPVRFGIRGEWRKFFGQIRSVAALSHSSPAGLVTRMRLSSRECHVRILSPNWFSLIVFVCSLYFCQVKINGHSTLL